MDLYANPKNHTERLYCTPLNSCYAYIGKGFSDAGPTHHGHTSRRWSPRPCSTERKSWLFVLNGAKPGKLPHGDRFWTA